MPEAAHFFFVFVSFSVLFWESLSLNISCIHVCLHVYIHCTCKTTIDVRVCVCVECRFK